MTTPTEEFFDRLSRTSHDPRLAKARGTLRVDLTEGNRTEHWHVAVLHGDLAVSRDDGPADGVLRAERPVFDQLVSGEMNPMAAILRGVVSYEGDPQFAVLFRRLFTPVGVGT